MDRSEVYMQLRTLHFRLDEADRRVLVAIGAGATLKELAAEAFRVDRTIQAHPFQ